MSKFITPETDVSWVKSLPEVGNVMIEKANDVDTSRKLIAELRRQTEREEAAVLRMIDDIQVAAENLWTLDEIKAAGGGVIRPVLPKGWNEKEGVRTAQTALSDHASAIGAATSDKCGFETQGYCMTQQQLGECDHCPKISSVSENSGDHDG